MDLGSIFLILALLVLVALYVSRPLFDRTMKNLPVMAEVSEETTADHQRSALMAERDRILNALQELDFDHVLGKIPEEDYPRQRAILVQRGADVLRQLDTLQTKPSDTTDVEDRIEAAIAARRADMQSAFPVAAYAVAAPQNGRNRGVSVTGAAPDDDLEIMLASRRRVRQEKASGFCPKCGGPVQKSDQFCPKCGAKL